MRTNPVLDTLLLDANRFGKRISFAMFVLSMRSMDSDYSDLISDGNVSFKHEEVVVQVSSAAYGSEMWTRRV